MVALEVAMDESLNNPSLHILIVDDRPDAVAALTQHLSARGHRVAAALNGMEALSILQRKAASQDSFQLVITDLNMPQLDGLGLLKELQRRQLSVCTALLVDQSQQLFEAKREAERLGSMLVCEKPVDLQRIDHLITAVVNRLNGVTTANEPFFGTTRMFRVTRPAVAQPPIAKPVSRADIVAEEFVGEESPPRPMVRLTVKLQRSVAPETARVMPPVAQVMRRVRSPMPPDEVSQAGYPVAPATASFQRVPTNPLIPVAPATDMVTKRPTEVAIPTSPPPVSKPSTGTFRRSVVPLPRPGQIARIPSDPFIGVSETSPQPETNPITTIRLRRGVQGSPSTTQVRIFPTFPCPCSACAVVFTAARKPVAYHVPCLSCGAMNRIEPG